MANTPLRVIKSQGTALAIKAATGEMPLVTDYENYTTLSFSPEQIKNLRVKLKSAMNAAPGEVRVDFAPIITPVVLEKIAPLALLGLLGVYLLGRQKVLF
jgi:hypothetical protein